MSDVDAALFVHRIYLLGCLVERACQLEEQQLPLYKRVEEVLCDSLFRTEEIVDGKPPSNAVFVQGVVTDFAFHPERLASHKDDVAAMCNELEDAFQKKRDGGHSFLNLCTTKRGELWGEHRNCEQLLVLAIGTGQGCFIFPREKWSLLPGSMPYVQFDTLKE